MSNVLHIFIEILSYYDFSNRYLLWFKILGLPILTFSGPENALWLTFSGPNFRSVFELVIFLTCQSLEKNEARNV